MTELTNLKCCKECGENLEGNRYGNHLLCIKCGKKDHLKICERSNKTYPEKQARRSKKYYETHSEKFKDSSKRRYEENPEYFADAYRKRQENGSVKEARRKLKIECLSHYSKGTMKCADCGETLIEFLSIDHLNGGGCKHRQQLRAPGSAFYRHLKKLGFPLGYQVLCMNCQRIKEDTLKKSVITAPGERDRKLMLAALMHYSKGRMSCKCCGSDNSLTIDHVGGGGTEHRNEMKNEGCRNIPRWLKKHNYPEVWTLPSGTEVRFQVLCMNCNFAIGTFGYCPHKESEISETENPYGARR